MTPAARPTRRSTRRLVATAALLASTAAAQAGTHLIGSGIYDITGPVAETGLFGYAALQEADGLHQRLRARAYVIAAPSGGQRVVFVSADLGAIFQSVKLEVVKRLRAKYGNLYSHDNVMLTATHTHVGTAGLSHYTLYAIASADKAGSMNNAQGFEATVAGIVAAIDRAHANLSPGSITLVQGDLSDATRNRSLPAYAANPDAGAYASNVNTTMTQLMLRKDSGREIGLINWFAVHPTSLSKDFTKVSGDSKGYASQFFERSKQANYAAGETFVAAFANADSGDVVPVDGNAHSAPGYEGSSDEYANATAAGERQLSAARQLAQNAGMPLASAVDARHQWVSLPGYTVRPPYAAAPSAVCPSAVGYSFAAGAENGPADVPGLYEGMTRSNTTLADAWWTFMTSPLGGTVQLALAGITAPFQDACQGAKPTMLATGVFDWAPQTLPFQVMQIGQLAIVGIPFEVTTMAGRRLRAQVSAQLAPKGVTQVVIAGLANSYAGYLTTAEEYATQQYEGASTQFGPLQLAATQQIVGGLAQNLVTGTPSISTAQPRDRSAEWRPERAGVWFDDKPLWESFGQVLSQPASGYARGQTASASFRGAHPKNNLRTQRTFLTVERLVSGQWQVVHNDWDWETTYEWKREGAAYSRVNISWRIPSSATPGTYRIRHFGNWKSGWTGAVSEYSGVTRSFSVW